MHNLVSPPLLFFVLGMIAVKLRSDLDVPAPMAKLLCFWLLVTIGLHGGFELRAGAGDRHT